MRAIAMVFDTYLGKPTMSSYSKLIWIWAMRDWTTHCAVFPFSDMDQGIASACTPESCRQRIIP